MNGNKLESMEKGGRILGQILQDLKTKTSPGMATKSLDDMTRRLCLRYGVKPSFLGYQEYPASVCVSINNEVVHGIPGERQLKDGDIISLDLGVYFQGFHTDAAITFSLGNLSPKNEKLIQVTKEALMMGIGEAICDKRIGDIGYSIQNFVEQSGFNIVRTLVGHSIGRKIHEEPLIPNFGHKNSGQIIQKGMTLAIEPMVTTGDSAVFLADDGWTYKTTDGSIASHFEHTIYVTDGKPIILTNNNPS